jgi:hypothetical protein
MVEEVANDSQRIPVVRSVLQRMIDTTGTRRFVTQLLLKRELPDVNESEIITFLEKLLDRRIIEQRIIEQRPTAYSLSHDYLVNRVREWFDPIAMERKRAEETLERGLAEWGNTKALLNRQQVDAVRKWVIALNQEEQRLLQKSETDYLRREREADLERDKARMTLLAIRARRAEADARSLDQVALAGALALESIHLARLRNLPTEADAIEIVRKALIQLPILVLTHGSDAVRSLAVLPDGRLASGSDDGTIKLWPRDGTGDPLVLTHGGVVLSLAVVPGGRLASSSDDGTIKLWPGDGTGNPVVLTHGDGVRSLGVLPDGRLASGGDDGTIKLWLVDEQKLIAALCLRAGRNLTKDEWALYIGADTPWQPSCRGFPSNWQTPD